MDHSTLHSWCTPTRIYASIGASSQLAQLVAGRNVLVVVDQRLRRQNTLVNETLHACAPDLVVECNPEDDGLERVLSLAVLLKTFRNPWVVAIGGGSVMDVAKAGILLHRAPELATLLRRGGPLFCGQFGALPMIAIPTTTGTAAEVSAVAVLRSQGRTTMLISPARPAFALLDPRLIDGLTVNQRLAGLLEPISRALVPAIAGKSLMLQDNLTTAILDTLLALGETLTLPMINDVSERMQWNLTASLASAQTHIGFLSLGRPPALHVLWPYATEIMAATGATKSSVLARLIPAWFDGIRNDLLPPAFGTRERVEEVMSGGMPALERVSAWCNKIDLGSIPMFNPEAVVDEVRRTWQASGLFLQDVAEADGLRLLELSFRKQLA